MPRIVVSTNPEGSLRPGMMNLAITPATNPMTMVQIMPTMVRLERAVWLFRSLRSGARPLAGDALRHLADLVERLARDRLRLVHQRVACVAHPLVFHARARHGE